MICISTLALMMMRALPGCTEPRFLTQLRQKLQTLLTTVHDSLRNDALPNFSAKRQTRGAIPAYAAAIHAFLSSLEGVLELNDDLFPSEQWTSISQDIYDLDKEWSVQLCNYRDASGRSIQQILADLEELKRGNHQGPSPKHSYDSKMNPPLNITLTRTLSQPLSPMVQPWSTLRDFVDAVLSPMIHRGETKPSSPV